MSSTKAQSQAPLFSIDEIGSKTLHIVAALAEASQRVVGQLMELSSSAAGDQLRTLGEMQSAAVEATRGVFAPVNPREAFEEFRQDPLAWYRKGFLSILDGSQRMFKLAETNAQLVSRDAERFQGSAERTGKEIQDTVSACVSRLRELYSARN